MKCNPVRDNRQVMGDAAPATSVTACEVERIRVALYESFRTPFSYHPDLRRRFLLAVRALRQTLESDLPERRTPTGANDPEVRLERAARVLAAAPAGCASNGYVNDDLGEAFVDALDAFDACLTLATSEVRKLH